jgi:GTP cyclohydrolase II
MHVPDRVIRPQLEVARATVPTRFGTFQMLAFRADDASSHDDHGLSTEHVALVMGELHGREDVLVRVHSECITSEVFGSLKCDCKQQLEAAQEAIAAEGAGAVIYLRQEGRGIGLTNKIRAYELQARGHDTVDANRLLGLPDDARDYGAAVALLAHLGVRSVRLMTNNPSKVSALGELGVTVVGREPVVVKTNPYSELYLETKRERMGHHLPHMDIPRGDAE